MESQEIINLIDNRIDDRITKCSKKLQLSNLETVTNKNNIDIPKEKYISRRKAKLLIIWD